LSLEKTILRNIKILVKKFLSERRFSRLKVSFTKTILKRVHISNKHHKSHIWHKNLKKIYFLATLAELCPLRVVYTVHIRDQSKEKKKKNPYELWNGKTPNLDYLKV
jgi:hypothetical protein